MPTSLAVWVVPLAAGLAAACSSDRAGGVLPDVTDGGPGDTTAYSREALLDPETCRECHQEHFREWSGSMHAYASIDPIFRAMNARGQKETNGALIDPDRITITIWLEPVGLEVIDDMIDSGFLDETFRELMPRYPIEVVGVPATDVTGRAISFEWTVEKALGEHNMKDGRYCLENTSPRFKVQVPP